MAAEADRNLLCGILALQMDFITRDALIAAMGAWVLRKSTPLGLILLEQGALSEPRIALLEALVREHLDAHEGDAARCLTALNSPESVRRDLEQLPDEDIQRSVARVSAGHTAEAPESTVTFAAVGSPTSSGLRFQILRPHARGGLGEVFVAHDRELKREVALKQIQSARADDEHSRARFLIEAEITGNLEHPGIVPVYGLGHYPDGRPFYAMRFIKGDSLKDAIARFHHAKDANGDPSARTLALRQLLGRFLDVCNAIAYAHSRGVIHRDIKPSNIMLGKYGETLVVDWGLAKSLGGEEIGRLDEESLLRPSSGSGSAETMPGSVVGTPEYMSPEQAAGRLERIGPASDVYSLGATLYCLLTGHAPFEDADPGRLLQRVQRGDYPSPSDVNAAVPPTLDAVCRKAMALEPADRYAAPRDLAGEIEHWLADEPVAAYPEGWGPRLSRWGRRHRTWMRAGALALVATATISVAALLLINQARENAVAARVAETKASKRAIAAARSEKAQREKVAQSLLDVQRLSARWALDRGLGLCEQGRADAGLLWLARGLELVPGDDPNLERVIRLNLDGWSRDVHTLRHALIHPGSITAVAFSPDGRSLCVGCEGGAGLLWDVASGRSIGRPMIHSADIRAVVFSPDGRRVLTACDDSTARLWDAADGRQVGQPLVHDAEVRAVAFSPDGRSIVTGSDDGTARLWEADGGRPRGQPLVHKGWVVAVAFSPDGRTVMTGSADRTARLWDARTGQPRAHPIEHFGSVNAVAISTKDPSLVASGDSGGWVRIQHDGSMITTSDQPGLGHPDVVTDLAFSPDGKVLVTACLDGSARVWDNGFELRFVLKHRAPVRSVAITPDGQVIVTGSDDGTARLWDSQTGLPLGQALAHLGMVRVVRCDPTGRIVISGGGDRVVRIWEVAAGPRRGKPMPHGGAIVTLAFTPDGRALLTGSEDRTARLWDASTGDPRTPSLVHLSEVDQAAFTPHGDIALTAARNGTGQLWDLNAGKPLGPPLVHDEAVTTAAISPDGRTAITGSLDGTARLWELPTGRPLGQMKQGSGVLAACFCPDGRSIITAGLDGAVRLWDPRGNPTRRFAAAGGAHTYLMTFSPDGKTLLAGGDGRAYIWDISSGQAHGSALEPGGSLTALAFRPDGRTALSATVEGTTRLWDVATARALGPPVPHAIVSVAGEAAASGRRSPRLVSHIHLHGADSQAFSPDGTLYLSGHARGLARFWDAETGHPIGPPLRRPGLVRSVAIRADGLVAATGGDERSAHLWDVPVALRGSPSRVILWAQVRAQAELEPDDTIGTLSASAWNERRRRLEQVAETQ